MGNETSSRDAKLYPSYHKDQGHKTKNYKIWNSS